MKSLWVFIFYISLLYPESPYVLTGREVIVYLPNYCVKRGYSLSKELARVADKIDYIIYAFAKPQALPKQALPGNVQRAIVELDNPNIDIGTKRDGKIRGNFAELKRLKKKFPHIKILLSVGGGAYKDLFNQIAEDNRLDELAQSCVDILSHTLIDGKKYKYEGLFDGIDIDWEFDKKGAEKYGIAFEKFIKKVREVLNKVDANYIYTMVLQPSSYFFEGPMALNLKKIASHLDWINLMAYNFHGLWEKETGFNAPIYGTTSDDKCCINYAIKQFKRHGVPSKKVALGVPFYGHSYKNVDRKNKGPNQTFTGGASAKDFGMKTLTIAKPGNIRFEDIEKLLKKRKHEYVLSWDNQARSSWIYNKKRKIFVSYDDERALKEKVRYCRKKGLGGVMIWEVSGDSSSGTLIRTLGDALKL